MAMQVGGAEDQSMVDINTTPLIDVMLVLLIMFIITIPVMTHAVKLDMPRGNATRRRRCRRRSSTSKWISTARCCGTALPVADEPTLLSYLQTESVKDPQPEIHLRPNKRVKYDYVARVLADAQRLGIRKIGFVGNEEFME